MGTDPLRVYIAARKQERAQELAAILIAAGHDVTSSWVRSADYHRDRTDAENALIAVTDHREVERSDCLVLIAEPPGEMVPGGKHVETGMALAYGLPVLVIGRRENIFHWHPGVSVVDDAQGAVAFLKSMDGHR